MGGATVTENSRVTLRFSLYLEDGTRVEGTREDESWSFQMGDGSLAPGLEKALMGLEEKKPYDLTLAPEEAFGYPQEGLVHTFPLDEFPAGIDPAPNQIISFSSPSGDEVLGRVLGIADGQAEVDFNQPLAGHTLRFTLEILALQQP